jgi:hypothetical protein
MSKRWLEYKQDWTFWTRNGRTGVDRVKGEHRFVTLKEFDEAIAKGFAVESSAENAAKVRNQIVPGVARPHVPVTPEMLAGHANPNPSPSETVTAAVIPVQAPDVPVEVQTADSTDPKKRTSLQKAVARRRKKA